jgi:hypothetical protein
MKWLRMTRLGLGLGCLAAAAATTRADDPPGSPPAFIACTPPRAERPAVPAGTAVPTFVSCRPVRQERTAVVPPAAVVPAVSLPVMPATTSIRAVAEPARSPIAPVSYTAPMQPSPPPVAPRLFPTTIVRGQMDESPQHMLPSGDDLAAAQADVQATLGNPVPPQPIARSMLPVQATDKGEPAPDPSKAFIPPETRTVPRYDAYTGAVLGVPGIVTGLPVTRAPVIYQAGPGTVFNDPLTNPRFWARGEFLYWWTNGYHLPILVTTSPATTPQALQGVLGVPGTVVLYGGNNTSNGPVPGGRFSFGWNFDPCGLCGIDASYFFLGRKEDNFFATGPVLARPFFNLNSGTQDRQLTSSPGINAGDVFKLRGSIAVNNFSDFQGGDINLRGLLCADCNYSLYGFAGFRYLDLHEKTTITEDVVSAAAVPGFPIFDVGNHIVVQDSFATRNQFYGGQVGLDGEIRRGRWFLGSRLQVGVGNTVETITINGSQTVTTLAGAQQVFRGGLLALPSNIGTFTANKFSVVPQVGVRVGYSLTDNMRVFVGYDFLFWSNVVRPGDQIDTTLNVTQIPNFAPPGLFPTSPIVRPIVPFRTTGFMAQGLSAGFEWRY